MRLRSSTLAGLLALAAVTPTAALIGYGIPMYDPVCAFACRASIEGYMLACSSHDDDGGGHSHGGGGPTSPECRASDSAFLSTLAFCINSTCASAEDSGYGAPVAPWKLERYWADKSTGDPAVYPKWTYGQALVEVGAEPPPTREVGEDEMLNFTALANRETWESQKWTLTYFESAETLHSRYGIALLVVGFGTPIAMTLLGRLPYASRLLDRLRPLVVYPSSFGTYHVRPLPYSLGNAPTIGQALYVALFLVLNIILTAVGYRSHQPNAWFATEKQEILGYLSCRTGVLAFALAPLVILFAGRNNILLWLTNWSHSTFLVLHRWVARIFTLQVVLHSITELVLYIDMGEFDVETKQEYWIWGIVATLACCIMVVVSALFFRRLSYEAFLILHILLAVFVLAGSWYHVELLFARKWGYEMWLYAACAVWFADRLLRVLRILKNGVRRAAVTEVAEGIVRIDVPGLRWNAEPGRHTYAYFPTLNPLRPWENHPFSVIPTALLSSPRAPPVSPTSSKSAGANAADEEKSLPHAIVTSQTNHHASKPSLGEGITLFVRKSAGITRSLSASSKPLLTLLDGPYPNNPTSAVLRSDRLILVAGGIGVTGVLPFVARHPNVKLCWSVRADAEGLVHKLEGALAAIPAAERDIRVGSRIDIAGLLEEEERAGWARIGVVVCGPGGLCDDVRAMVAARGRTGRVVWDLEVDAFSW